MQRELRAPAALTGLSPCVTSSLPNVVIVCVSAASSMSGATCSSCATSWNWSLFLSFDPSEPPTLGLSEGKKSKLPSCNTSPIMR